MNRVVWRIGCVVAFWVVVGHYAGIWPLVGELVFNPFAVLGIGMIASVFAPLVGVPLLIIAVLVSLLVLTVAQGIEYLVAGKPEEGDQSRHDEVWRAEPPNGEVPQPRAGGQSRRLVISGAVVLVIVLGVSLVGVVASYRSGSDAVGNGGGTSSVPQYRVVSGKDYPLKDRSGPIQAKSLLVHTETTSERAFRRIAEDVRDRSLPEQHVIGLTLGDTTRRGVFNKKSQKDGFVVIVRNGRAARAMGLHGNEFEDGGIVVDEVPRPTK